MVYIFFSDKLTSITWKDNAPVVILNALPDVVDSWTKVSHGEKAKDKEKRLAAEKKEALKREKQGLPPLEQSKDSSDDEELPEGVLGVPQPEAAQLYNLYMGG